MSRDIGDHPDIAALERTGYPAGWKRRPCCPICGEELNPGDKVFSNWREVLGCEHCIEEKEACEVWEGDEK